MPRDKMQADEVLDQVLEDELTAAVQEVRERQEIAVDAAELADV